MIVHMIGNAHIDPVWLWPWQAGVDEVLATFRSAVDRCREYPEFVFTRGEAWAYRVVEQIDPALFEDVRRLVAGGQWHVTGGQWIQPDVNLPTYEGLRRQIIHGRRYFKEKFNVTPDVGYNVDSFGHPATLPDLLAAEGYQGYVFHRPSQAQTPVPAATFRWRGANYGKGGGEVLGFRIPSAYVTRSDDLYGQIMLSLDAADAEVGHVMCFYGVGNHGGGPTKGNIEYILANRRAFDGAELRFSTPKKFFDAVQAKRDRLPVVDFELQRTFPGCYVVMQGIKREQRHSEHLLMQTEAAIDAWADADQKPALAQKLDAAWEDLLFTQFHDILAGTSVAKAWASVHAMQGRARITAEELLTHVTRQWARQKLPRVNHQQIAVLNPGPGAFEGLIEHDPFLDFAALDDRWIADEAGNPVPMQHVQAQSTIMLTSGVVFPAKIGPGTAKLFTLRDDPRPAAPTAANPMTATPTELASAHVALRLGPTGVEQIRCGDVDLLGGGGLSLRLREDKADTWGFQIDRFAGPITDALSACEWVVEETGPLRAKVRTQTVLGRSPVLWTLTLAADSPAIEMRLQVQFIEQYRLLQMPVRLPATPSAWRCGLAGGAVTREPSPVEWPLQGWTSTPPLAVLSQDANSASLDGDELTWSLLRATRMAWAGGDASLYAGRDEFADQGPHAFVFHLLPTVANVPTDAELHARAAALARSPIVFDRYEGMDRPPWGNRPPRRLWTPAEHRARKDGRMTDLPNDGGAAFEEKGQGDT